MRFECNYTLDEVLYANERLKKYSKEETKRAVILFLGVSLFCYAVNPAHLLGFHGAAGGSIFQLPAGLHGRMIFTPSRVLYTLIFSTVISYAIMRWADRKDRREARVWLGQMLDQDGLIRFALELKEEGLTITQGGEATVHQWNEVEKIDDTDDALIIVWVKESGVFLPKRAFKSQVEERQFFSLAQSYLRRARSGSANCN